MLLFVREFKADSRFGGAAAYTYLGTVNYVRHEGSRPMNITWKLDRPIPARILKKTNKLIVGVKIVKIIRVVAAVICDSIQTKHKIYATARGYGDYKGQWEFPGGKIEPGEAPQQALKREIEEELDTEIAVHDKIGTIEYDYPTFHLSMDCFWCTVVSGELILKEAEAACWLTKDELDSVQWLPADQTILEKIREMMK